MSDIGWWCDYCGVRHITTACPNEPHAGLVASGYVPMGGVAGHCGKCGAPYTCEQVPGGTGVQYVPLCKCWNV